LVLTFPLAARRKPLARLPTNSAFIGTPLEAELRAAGASETDDNLIIDLIVSKRSLDGFVREGVSRAFAEALATGADFVHIVADRPSDIEVFR
jgi:hypothetical protein